MPSNFFLLFFVFLFMIKSVCTMSLKRKANAQSGPVAKQAATSGPTLLRPVRPPPVVVDHSSTLQADLSLYHATREAMHQKHLSYKAASPFRRDTARPASAASSAAIAALINPPLIDTYDRNGFLQAARAVEDFGAVSLQNVVGDVDLSSIYQGFGVFMSWTNCSLFFICFTCTGATQFVKKDKRAFQEKKLKEMGVEVYPLIVSVPVCFFVHTC